jgi:hypothetical protein
MGPTQTFRTFVDRLAPGAPDDDRRRFYGLRSAITHGGKALLLNWLHIPALR